MRSLVFALLSAPLLLQGQVPALTGVWKADLTKTHWAPSPGPPPSKVLIIFEQRTALFNKRSKEQAPQVVETAGTWGEHGQQRSVLTFFLNGKPIVLPYSGVPTRLTGSAQSGVVSLRGETPGSSRSFDRKYELSGDGNVLTEQIVNRDGANEQRSAIVLTKQPDSAGEELRQPEELAAAHFKNVKTASLKNLPASEFIDQMHYFAWALNRNCTFCHVERKFESDDKEEKRTAREMLDMVSSINHNFFKDHPEVKCFTCHEGHAHPLRYFQFADEAAAEKAALEKEREMHGPPPSSK